MGTDLYGWVEIKRDQADKYWDATVKAGSVATRNYIMFATLFGTRNAEKFKPIAARRGIPTNAARETYTEFEKWGADAHSPTSITWSEIKSIDWNEEAENSIVVYEYKKGKNAELIRCNQFYEDSRLTPEAWNTLLAGGTWEVDDTLFKIGEVKKRRRRDALENKDWELLFKLMEMLAERYGDDNVRMVVWFIG